jgi:hypothetical protein
MKIDNPLYVVLITAAIAIIEERTSFIAYFRI